MPLSRPNLDFNTREGQETLGLYRDASTWTSSRSQKARQYVQITTMIQKADETSTNFYDRLCEAFQTYTPFDPETPKNQQMTNAAFVAQSYADIQ